MKMNAPISWNDYNLDQWCSIQEIFVSANSNSDLRKYQKYDSAPAKFEIIPEDSRIAIKITDSEI